MLECEKLEEVGWEEAFSNQHSAVSPNLFTAKDAENAELVVIVLPESAFLTYADA
jgi:hypothetical protein